ncbi:MAG: hypothetical protein FJ135_01850 [Deltaproteobacteria bacterium]|nr:hypothetical protein [Deltaproteobacteria bacterium]
MRFISPAFQDVIAARQRRPAYRIYAWDPSQVAISEIASAPSNRHATIPVPFDLTPYASEITWSDRQLSFTLADPGDLFHPDTGPYRDHLKDAAIIRLVEGDEALDEEDWITTFTGQIHGQIGWKKGRRTGQTIAKVTVFNRGETQAFKRRKITSKEYTVGTDIGIALYDICETFMGLTPKEIRLTEVVGRQFKHKVNQLAQVTPWEGICSILEVVCYQPYFDGEGKLAYVNKNLNRHPDLVLSDYTTFVETEIPERTQDAINKVKVTFLDSNLERVDSPYQQLGTAQVTTGFFSMGETLECWWSSDHKQRASGTSMRVVKSVNSGLLPVGTESYRQMDEFHGVITVEINVWVPILATVCLAEYLILAHIMDKVAGGQPVACPPGGGIGGTLPFGMTIPWGRVLQAQALIGILLIMMSIGSAQYEVWGTPYDYAYLEKQSIAIEEGLDYWLENEKEIKNDFIGTHDQADTVAVTELIWEKSMSLPRRIVIEDHPALEPGDIVALPDGRKMVVTSLSKKIKRGEVVDLTLDGGKVLAA